MPKDTIYVRLRENPHAQQDWVDDSRLRTQSLRNGGTSAPTTYRRDEDLNCHRGRGPQQQSWRRRCCCRKNISYDCMRNQSFTSSLNRAISSSFNSQLWATVFLILLNCERI